MYTRGSIDSDTSRVVFNNKFEITFSSNSDEKIESIKELWSSKNTWNTVIEINVPRKYNY